MRIIALMVVAKGEAQRYLDAVLSRLEWWTDEIVVVFDKDVGDGAEEWVVAERYTDVMLRTGVSFTEHEGKFRQAAWDAMVALMEPHEGLDYIACVDADEVVIEHDIVKTAIREHYGKRLAFTFYHMWDPDHYRVDGQWFPHPAWVLFPYRKAARFRDRELACGREPTYTEHLPRLDRPIGHVLHYGYMREKDKLAKYKFYMEHDGGRYHSLDHLKSIQYPPSLEEWRGGGLLDG